jgi:hypothetical protein
MSPVSLLRYGNRARRARPYRHGRTDTLAGTPGALPADVTRLELNLTGLTFISHTKLRRGAEAITAGAAPGGPAFPDELRTALRTAVDGTEWIRCVRAGRSIGQDASGRSPAVDLLPARGGGAPADAYPDATVHDALPLPKRPGDRRR